MQVFATGLAATARVTSDRPSSSQPAIMLLSSDSTGGQAKSSIRDDELLALIRSGDEGAFEVLFRAHAIALRAFALEYVKSRDIAVEVVHDVFLRIWERRERLEIRESFKAYIYRATRNRALDVVKRSALEQRYVEESMLRWKSGLRYDEIAELMGTSTKTVENQMTRALRELRARLAPYL